MSIGKIITVTLLYTVLIIPPVAQAKAQHTFKIASLAPEGSVWVTSFKEFSREVHEKTGGAVSFRLYPGGVMGDDRAMYRKMRVGQLHGGGFTMSGIAEVVKDFRVMAIPFLFQSYDEVDHVSGELQPLFKKRFAEKGMELIAMTEVGFIYTFSTKPRISITDLQQAKTWAPADDPLTGAFLGELGVSPIGLSIPDVLSSLQTGLIDTAFNSLYGSIVLQWFTKAPFVTDEPYGYAYGGFIMSGKAMAKLSEDQRAAVDAAAAHYFPALIEDTRNSNHESREVLASQGVRFVSTSPEIVASLRKHRDTTINKVLGTSFSKEAYQIVQQSLTDYRGKK